MRLNKKMNQFCLAPFLVCYVIIINELDLAKKKCETKHTIKCIMLTVSLDSFLFVILFTYQHRTCRTQEAVLFCYPRTSSPDQFQSMLFPWYLGCC